MAKIHLRQLDKVIDVEPGSNMMTSLLNAEVPVASSCRGDGVCAKCILKITSGQRNLSAPEDLEKKRLHKELAGSTSRLSCQCLVFGDVSAESTYW